MPRILLVEDNQKLAEMVADYLGDNGYNVDIAGTAKTALKKRLREFDAVILDLMLPDMDGLDLCKKMLELQKIPILMLTAKGDPMDRVIGLEIGADDYLPKPFEPRELLARIRAILRRGTTKSESVMVFGELTIDPNAMVATVNRRRCNLTAHQFGLLLILAQAAGKILNRDQIMEKVKGHELEAFDRSIDVHVSRIRAEIEKNPKKPERILTVRGAGYMFANNQK